MRIAWLTRLALHFDEFDYSKGPLPATVGTVSVLLTALLVGHALRRRRAVALTAAALTSAAGIGWLALH
ncbi:MULTISPECIES: hypothetical protein [Streptomyces]|uniref:hypothetical protein n=1 Tax=Streptomyces TaxID=1883 RepID=UPI0004CCB35B|nr:hypothetical protein [Streptomyces durhamensis]